MRAIGNLRRHGHTLLELVISATVTAALLAGLGSTIFLASRIAAAPGPANDVLDASKTAAEIVDELTYATYLTERSAGSIEFLVRDRDGDGARDVIRYEWSGTPGDPLFRTFNRGTPQSIAENVQEFALTYDVKEEVEEVPTAVESAEQLLIAHTALFHDHSRSIQADDWVAQYFHPDGFGTPLPQDTIGWKITKATFQGAQVGEATGELLVQIREAGGDMKPTSKVLAEEQIAESSLGVSYGWREVVFGNPATGLHPGAHSCLAIVWHSGGVAGKVRRDDHGGSGWLETTDYGATWKYEAAHSMYYGIYGTVTTPGPPRNVVRRYLSGVRISLRTGDDSISRVDTAAQVLNTPELLSGYWKLDFDTDPTELDVNGDGQGDWVRRDGQPFDTATMAGGVWSADATLDTNPEDDFAGLTTVEARFRSTSIGGQGALFWINADWSDSGMASPIYVSLKLQPDGTQTFEAFRKRDDATPVRLVTVPGLDDGFVDLRLVIEPESDFVVIWVNDAPVGSYSYDRFSPSGKDRFASILASGSSAEFDYVSIRAGE